MTLYLNLARNRTVRSRSFWEPMDVLVEMNARCAGFTGINKALFAYLEDSNCTRLRCSSIVARSIGCGKALQS